MTIQYYINKENRVRKVEGQYYWPYELFDKATDAISYYKLTDTYGCCSNPSEGFEPITGDIIELSYGIIKITKKGDKNG